MDESPHQFFIVQVNATKPIVCGEPGKLGKSIHTFHVVWMLFSQ